MLISKTWCLFKFFGSTLGLVKVLILSTIEITISFHLCEFVVTTIWLYRVVQVNPAFFYFQFWHSKHYSINMGILPVVIYVISGLEPKFHWNGMKNEWCTYDYLYMGKIQVRRIFGNSDESRFGRCEAVTKPFLRLQASKTFQSFPES